ncbi:MAG: mechanosensitive ion channel, partial [Alphaproteobacteria bacterium]|nr:mechanosensitive ion channel [Alphaproteobacteria bacterium]
RRLILARFGRDPATDDPAYARRLLGAIAEGVARGIVPGSILALFFVLVITGRTPFDGEMARLLAVVTGVGTVVVVAIAMTGAVFAPDLPSWRLVSVSREHARTIGRRLGTLIGLFAIDVLLTANADVARISPELRSFYALVAGGVIGTTMLLLARPSLWLTVEGAIPDEPRFDDDETPAQPATAGGFWAWVRRLSVVVIVVGIAALLVGYYNLGSFLIDSLLVSFLIVGALALVRGLLRESVGVLTRSDLARERLGLTAATRHRIKFWLRAALDPLLMLLAALFVAPVWGVPIADMWQWTVRVLSGFQIGNVTISISDIALALAVFTGLVFAIRLIQRGLSDRILPETALDPGLQHSLSAGFGYVGLIAAFVIGVTVMGIDLSTLALIAGALSVGIGFGLRDVVNNFVCGLILLIERPIKVGDWVVIGTHEGFVKQINLRATEIETWQRAAVFVPNAEIIGNPMTNWTHKDKYGRIDVPVRVAYGSDLETVERILLEAARQHPKILLQPEPFVLLRDFADYGFFYELRAFTGDVIWTVVTASEMRVHIDARFREEGIVIPFPQRTLHEGYRGEGANAPLDQDGERLDPANPPRPRVVAGTVRSDPTPSPVARGGQGETDG